MNYKKARKTVMSPTHATRCQGADNRQQSFILRRRGYSYQEIGDELGISPQCAHQHVTSVLKESREITGEVSDDVRELELKRIDLMLKALSIKAARGDEKAIETTIKLMARRTAYLGLDVATKQELAVTTSLYDMIKKADDIITPVETEIKKPVE
jgi:predicted transcriptional regulator